MMRKIAIIPARGGSKRIKRKNIKEFAGSPIISYVINTAIYSDLFDEVIVSTDDVEIAEVSKQYGATVPFLRSKKNSDDVATTSAVLEEVISYYPTNHFTYGCCLYPTAVFITPEILNSAYDQLVQKRLDTVFPVVAFSHPIQRSLMIQDDLVSMVNPEFNDVRTQDLETRYHDAGQFYLFNIDSFLIKKRLFTDNSGAYVIDQLHAQDIDNESDWKLAELKYSLLHNPRA